MREVVARARSRGAGWVYVTDDRLANPWDETPGYWDALIDAVEAANLSVETTEDGRARLRARPNPARVAIRFELPEDPGSREIEILDAAGRQIALIGPGSLPEWDGYDRQGRPAPAGIYFARLRGARAEPARVALVR
jgi:hypothetical protein